MKTYTNGRVVFIEMTSKRERDAMMACLAGMGQVAPNPLPPAPPKIPKAVELKIAKSLSKVLGSSTPKKRQYGPSPKASPVGKLLLKLRTERNRSQEQVAKALKCSRSLVAMVERGQVWGFSRDKAERAAKFFGVPAKRFVGGK